MNTFNKTVIISCSLIVLVVIGKKPVTEYIAIERFKDNCITVWNGTYSEFKVQGRTEHLCESNGTVRVILDDGTINQSTVERRTE